MVVGSSVEESLSLKSDFDWNEDDENELRAIESAYAASKRKISDSDTHSSPHRRRRLPDWAHVASSHADTSHRFSTVNAPCSFTPTPCRGNLKLRHSVFTFGGRIVYGKTFAEVIQATKEILDKIKQLKHKANEISLGFDLEWRPVFKKGQAPRKTSVMQICMDSSDCYVMHIIHSGIPPILKSLLEDPSLFKVGIGIANDVSKISRDYNINVTSLVDLSRYANLKLGGTPKNWGLSSLTEMLACKQLLKPSKIRMGNWEAFELSKDQIHYAATDAFASWYLYQLLQTFPDLKPKS